MSAPMVGRPRPSLVSSHRTHSSQCNFSNTTSKIAHRKFRSGRQRPGCPQNMYVGQAWNILLPISLRKFTTPTTNSPKKLPMLSMKFSPSANFVAGVIAPVGPLWQS